MTSFGQFSTNYNWTSEDQMFEDPQNYDLDPLPDYQRASSYCQVEDSFPHLMPFLDSYSPLNNSTPSYSPHNTDPSLPPLSSSYPLPSSLHHSQPLSPTSLSNSLSGIPLSNSNPNPNLYPDPTSYNAGGRFSLPDIITPARNSPPMSAIRTHTGTVYQSRSMVSTVAIVGSNNESEEEDSGEGSECSDDESMIVKRRSAIATLPNHDGGIAKKSPLSNQPKKRQRTSPAQLEVLEKIYQTEKLPNSDLRKELASNLKMTPRRVQVWFQNKRAKDKRNAK